MSIATELTLTERISRFARPCVWLFTASAGLFGLGVLAVAAAVLIYRGPSPVVATFWGVNASQHVSDAVAVAFLKFSFAWRALLALIQIAVATPIVLIFWTMRRLFLLYARGVIFAADNIALIRAIAWLLIIYPFVRSVGEILFELIAKKSISQAGFDIDSILFGISVLFVARVMDLGRELQNEQAQFL